MFHKLVFARTSANKQREYETMCLIQRRKPVEDPFFNFKKLTM